MIRLNLLFITLLLSSLAIAETGQWLQKSSLPASGRHGAIGFSIGNKGYVGMGHINSGAAGEINFNDLWEYDSSTNSWTQKPIFQFLDFHSELVFHIKTLVLLAIVIIFIHIHLSQINTHY